ncbi:MAG TPA: nucleoside-diphosphate sugar epimerase [Ignavibacteriales bacterium]|nr:nucleoside-diphosphate sugar epimerase [Ignavibacteriales bacterium]
MSEKKVIAVIGATGAQGGGLVRAILADKSGEFTARALTRDVNSEKAKALSKLGAEVVKADLDDYESLKKSFTGAYGVYAVTNFWEHFSPEKEIAQAASIAKAAKEAEVKHVIWSSLDDTRKWIPLSDDRMPTLKEKYKVPHFDAKGESNKFFIESGVPTTILNTVFYWENFVYFGQGPKKGSDGKITFTIPMSDKKLPSIAAEDIGKCAYGVFKNGNEYIGKTIGIAGEQLTGKQFAEAFTKVLGKEVIYAPVTPEVYRGFGFPGADDMGNMYQFKAEFEEDYCNSRSVELARKLNPTLQTFESWLKENGTKIPLE